MAETVFTLLIALLASLPLIGARCLVAQTTEDISHKAKVDVDLVTTDVSILSTIARELRAEDVIIYDNNVAQKISYFSHDQLPVALALVFDDSSSLAYLPSIKYIALSALRQLKPEDQVALFSLAGGVSRISGLTEVRTKPWTNIYDAIYEAAQYLNKNTPDRRRAIILISENCQTSPPKHGADSCLVKLLETLTVLYNIKIGDIWNDPYCKDTNSVLEGLVEKTGGKLLNVNDSLKDAMEMAVSLIRMQYTIGFNPSNPGIRGSFHKLEAKCAAVQDGPDCRLSARSGYYAGIALPLLVPKETVINTGHPYHEINQLLMRQTILTDVTMINKDLHDISFLASTVEQMDSKGKPQAIINLQIYLDGINFSKIEDKHTCNLRIYVFYADEKGRILGSKAQTVGGLFTEEFYGRAMRTGIPFSEIIPLKTKNQVLKIVLYDEGSGKTGSRLIKLQNGRYAK